MRRKKYKKSPRSVKKPSSRSPTQKHLLLAGIIFVASFFFATFAFHTPYSPTEKTHATLDARDNIMLEGENQSHLNSQAVINNVILHGSRDKKEIALTFDADMTSFMKLQLQLHPGSRSFNKTIIDTLEKTNTKATIFITGMWAELYPSETRTIAQNSLFEIGSHSYSHQSFHGICFGLGQLPQNQVTKEIGYTEGLLEQIAGVKIQFFRFPGGCFDKTSVAAVNAAGEQVVHWDIAGEDGFNSNTQSIIDNVTRNAQNGSIIVLHLNGSPNAPKTAEALPTIIQTLKQKGYTFVKVNELLNLPAETRVQG